MGRRFVPEPRDRVALRPRGGLAAGRIRARILEIREELLGELRALDVEAQGVVDRRAVLVDGLRQCRDALGGSELRFACRDPLPREADAEPDGTMEVGGEQLRSALRRVLEDAARPLTIDELHRGLLVRGLRARGRASRTISNALAIEMRRGRVARVRRGEYVSGSR